MNTALAILSLFVIFEATHYGMTKTGERLVPELLKKSPVVNSGFGEITGLIFSFIIWILQIYLVISLFEFITIDFTEKGKIEITNLYPAAEIFLVLAALSLVKGMISVCISKKEKTENTSVTNQTKHGELI